MDRRHRPLGPAELRDRLAELLDLGGYHDRLCFVNSPHGTDPSWMKLLRPDGEQHRVARASIRALVSRGLLKLECEKGPRVYMVCEDVATRA